MRKLFAPLEEKHLPALTFRKRFGKYGWIVVVGVLILFGGGLLLAAKNKQTPTQDITAKILPSPIQPRAYFFLTPTPDGWQGKEFVNTLPDGGYKIQYPENWKPSASTDTKGGLVGFYDPIDPIKESGKPSLGVTIISKKDLNKYPLALTDYEKQYKAAPGEKFQITREVIGTKIANAKVDGIDAVKYSVVSNSGGAGQPGSYAVTGYYIQYDFIKDNFMYEIIFDGDSPEFLKDNQPLIDHIINSFHFIDTPLSQ